MSKRIIAVVGGTGLQGGGLVDELLARGHFSVRVVTRNADSEKANALKARGCEVVAANLTQPDSLPGAFGGAYGVFAVTNFWEPVEGWSEFDQGKAAVHAAHEAGVQHYIWSTLPNCKAISNGKYEVPHFTEKARVDAEVTAAGFAHHTFVEPPMYFQNFLSTMAPQPQEDGSKAWFMPMSVDNRCMHVGDISEFGRLAARAFEQPDKYGGGQHLAQAAGLLSWQDMILILTVFVAP